MSGILAIETSGSFCSVAVRDERGIVTARSSSGDGDHFERLPGLTSDVLAASGIPVERLSEVRVGLGPGSFTGIRIGMSFAKGLAWRARVPLRGFSSFEGFAAAAWTATGAAMPIVVIADARRDELFLGVYEVSAGAVTCRVEPRIVPQSELQTYAEQERIVSPLRGFTVPGIAVDTIPDGATGLLDLPDGVSGEPFSAAQIAGLEPTYLRAVAAKSIEERRALSRG